MKCISRPLDVASDASHVECDASTVASPAGGLCNKTLLALFDDVARKYGLDLAQLRVFADHLAKALDV